MLRSDAHPDVSLNMLSSSQNQGLKFARGTKMVPYTLRCRCLPQSLHAQHNNKKQRQAQTPQANWIPDTQSDNRSRPARTLSLGAIRCATTGKALKYVHTKASRSFSATVCSENMARPLSATRFSSDSATGRRPPYARSQSDSQDYPLTSTSTMARTSVDAQRTSTGTKKTTTTKATGPPLAKFPQKLLKQQKKTPVLTKEEREEMRRLSKMLPVRMQAANRDVDPCTLINDATRYINHLTAAIVSRVRNGTLPEEALLRLRLPTTEENPRRK
uniref:BHLH domain-containing protein n=1 Tax=Steinernema glaseri TaxID=37863 RepID=A0A1I7YTF5_9BILA